MGIIQQMVQHVMCPEEISLGDIADFVLMEMSENTIININITKISTMLFVVPPSVPQSNQDA